MKSLLTVPLLAMLAFAAAPCLLAQAPPTPEEMEELSPQQRAARLEMSHDELATLERENAHAYQQRNVTFFRRVYSDDFVGISATGVVMDKSAFLNSLQTTAAFYSSFVVSDIRVRIYKEVAVVNSTWNVITVHEGHSVGQQLRVTHLYVYGQRGWQAVLSQTTLLPG